MKSLFVIALALFLSASMGAQTASSIRGLIRDGGVRSGPHEVELIGPDGTKRIARSNQYGDFRFDGLTAGTYKISARIREQTIEKEVQLNGSERVAVELEFDSALTLGQPIRETVMVSADKPQPIDEVSKTVNVITGQEMRDRADITLVDSLRSVPGFRVQQLGGFGRTASIKTRGLRNQDTSILIDGVRFRDAAAITGEVGSFLSDITLTSVSRVEVLRGSGSSLYGTNAIGGTVNFITPTAPSGWHGQVSGAFGWLGMGRFRGNTSYGTDGGKFGFNVGVSRTAYTKGIDGNDNASNTNFQPRFDFKPTNNTSIGVRFFFSDARVRLNANPDTTSNPPATNAAIINANEGINFVADADDPDAVQESRAFNGVVNFTHLFTSKVWLSGYYSGLQTKRRNNNGILGPGFQSASTSHNDGEIHTANVNANFAPRFQSIKAGYEFEHEKYSNENLTPSGIDDNWTRAFQSSHTLFAQDVISLVGGRLQLAGGVRAQWFDLKLPEFSLNNTLFANTTTVEPEAAYTFDGAVSYYFANTGTKLRAHVGNGYRVPSLYERFGSYFDSFAKAPGFAAIGDPGLKPEKTIAVDAGIEQDLASNKIRLTATYFYTHLRDVIGYGSVQLPDPNGRFSGYLNAKGGIARGAEFSGTFKPTKSTDIFSSYTFTNSDQLDAQVFGTGVIETLGIPKHQFTLVATQRIKRFWVNADVLVNSEYLAPIFSNWNYRTYLYRFGGNRRVDVTAGYTFPINKDKFSLRVFGTIENLFDNEYFENGFRTVPRNGRVGVSFGF
ncbi:MAG TPA: TonB-dependent receptor [Pyrinomonadaceae bacterium]|nr:TonB-dependent receptor [Pyrinomonadaceae bacterium]